MKHIVLKPVEIYENHMLIDVYDYTYPIYEIKSAQPSSVRRVVSPEDPPVKNLTGNASPGIKSNGKPKLRKRMTIDVDYSSYDISGIREECPTLEDALEHYRGYIYKLVRARILDDWSSDSLPDVLEIIREKIAKYYE